MNQHNRRQFLAELGNIFIQFQIEMMQREKTVTAAKQEEVTAKNGASAQADNKPISTIHSTIKSKG